MSVPIEKLRELVAEWLSCEDGETSWDNGLAFAKREICAVELRALIDAAEAAQSVNPGPADQHEQQVEEER